MRRDSAAYNARNYKEMAAGYLRTEAIFDASASLVLGLGAIGLALVGESFLAALTGVGAGTMGHIALTDEREARALREEAATFNDVTARQQGSSPVE